MLKRLKETLPRLARLFLYVWLGTLGVFVLLIFLNLSLNKNWAEPLQTIFLIDIITGVASFILMCIFAFFGAAIRPEERKVGLVKTKKSTKRKTSNRLSYYMAGGIVFLIIAVGFLYQRTIGLENAAKVKEDNILNTTSSPTPTTIPKVKGATVADSDPITDCVSSHPNCNGESIRLKQSQCKNIICCQVGNTWSVYASVEKCKEAQNSSQPAQQVQKPTTPTNQLNFYCYDNTLKYSYYTSSGEQCNKNNRISSCKGMVKSTYDLCMQSCLNTANEGTGICIWGYGAGGNVEDNPDLLQQCFDENSVEHQSCMDACSGPYQSNSLNCNNTP